MFPDRLVLTFHGIGAPSAATDAAERPYWVTPEVLGAVIQQAQADRRIEITFDDGFASDFDIACPMLAEAGLSSTFFVLAGRLDRPGSLSRMQVAEMAAMGMGIGNHGMDHRDWTSCADDVLHRELHDARHIIEDAAGCPVDSLSIPFGAFDRRVLQKAFEAGYRRVFTSSGGLARRGDRLVPRNTVCHDFDAPSDIARLAGWGSRARSAVRNPLRARKYGVNTWMADHVL